MATDTASSSRPRPIRLHLLWPLLGIALVAGFAWAATPDRIRAVVAPGLVVVVLACLYVAVIRARDRRFAPLEIGSLYVAVVSLYGVYPLVSYIANDFTYSVTNDFRLYYYQPTPSEVASLAWYYPVYLASFIGAYLLARGRLPPWRVELPRPGSAFTMTVVVAYVAVELFILLLIVGYNLRAGTYVESYLMFSRLPLLLQQLVNHLGGARFTLSILVLLILFHDHRRHRLLIAGWILLVAVNTLLKLGNRTDLALLVLSAGIIYDRTVRPIRLRTAALTAVLGLSAFLAFGVVRLGPEYAEAAAGNVFRVNSEFEVLFANAYDLRERRALGLTSELGMQFYFADLLALVPQQLLAIRKISPADWYIETFYLPAAQRGMGFVFGTVAEAIVGNGAADLVWRGAVIGLVFAWLHRRVVLRPGYWWFAYYVFMTALSYQSFRNTTFYFLVLSFYRFLVPLLVIEVVAALIRRTAGGSPATPVPGASVA
jgi:hypothetical protein